MFVPNFKLLFLVGLAIGTFVYEIEADYNERTVFHPSNPNRRHRPLREFDFFKSAFALVDKYTGQRFLDQFMRMAKTTSNGFLDWSKVGASFTRSSSYGGAINSIEYHLIKVSYFSYNLKWKPKNRTTSYKKVFLIRTGSTILLIAACRYR